MRPKKSVNELEEGLRESRPPATAVPPHFRQKLRQDLQTQATNSTSPPLARGWLLAPVVLLTLVIVAFWYGWPKTAIEPAIDINTTRPASTPDPSSVSINREQALQAALTFARRKDNKPIGGWLVEPMIDAITATASLETYSLAVNRLGGFAVADYGGSNILFPENESEMVWFVQLVGSWQPFGETADKIEPSRYVGILVNPNTGQVAAAGSSTVPFMSEPIMLSLADYPSQESPYLVEQEAGFWLVHSGSQILAFDRRAPYPPDLTPNEEQQSGCLYIWVEVSGNFEDPYPCSDYAWNLDGTLNVIDSRGLWRNRSLDQYRVEVIEGNILVHLDEIHRGGYLTSNAFLGTPEQPETDLEAVSKQVAVLVEQYNSSIRRNGWRHSLTEIYASPSYYENEYDALFPTEQMLLEGWHHASGNDYFSDPYGYYDQNIFRYFDAIGNYTGGEVFIGRSSAYLTPDSFGTHRHSEPFVPSGPLFALGTLRQKHSSSTDPIAVAAYALTENGRAQYTIKITLTYATPLPADQNDLGQTIVASEETFICDLDTGQLLFYEGAALTDTSERIIIYSFHYLSEEWLTTLPEAEAALLEEGKAMIDDPDYVPDLDSLNIVPTVPDTTSVQPVSDFDTVIEQTTTLAEQRQAFLSSQSGWFYGAVQEYQPLDSNMEDTSFFATFSTEQMLRETWYHALADGSVDQVINRYTNVEGLVVGLTVFIDGYIVNFFGDTIDQTPQQLFAIPNEANWVAESLDEMQAHTVNKPSVSAYVEQVDGRSHHNIHITNNYNIPLPAETNQFGQTIVGDETNYVFDFDTGQFLSQENMAITDAGERVVSFSRTFETEEWVTALPEDIALYLAQAQARLDNSNLTWVAPTATPDFSPSLAQVSDTQYGITVSVLDVFEAQDEVAVRMVAQVDPSWGVIHAFPFYQTFISDALLYGEQPFTPTHTSGEVVEADEVTSGWREGSTHYFEGAWIAGEALRMETAVDLTGIARAITLPITLTEAAVGQSWSLDWPLAIGSARLQLAEVVWMSETADGQVELQLQVRDDSPPEIDIYCLSIGTADPWQEDCPLFEEEAIYRITVPPDAPIVLHLRVSLLVSGFELLWRP